MSDLGTRQRDLQAAGERSSRRHPLLRASTHRRKLRIYSESLSGLNEDYVAQTLRLVALDMAANTNMNMIDRFMQRLAPMEFEPPSASRRLGCPA